VDEAALQHLHEVMQAASGPGSHKLSRGNWAWFLSFLCSHPSDFAFDFVSKTLKGDGVLEDGRR
jgi:hypothetical protein